MNSNEDHPDQDNLLTPVFRLVLERLHSAYGLALQDGSFARGPALEVVGGIVRNGSDHDHPEFTLVDKAPFFEKPHFTLEDDCFHFRPVRVFHRLLSLAGFLVGARQSDVDDLWLRCRKSV